MSSPSGTALPSSGQGEPVPGRPSAPRPGPRPGPRPAPPSAGGSRPATGGGAGRPAIHDLEDRLRTTAELPLEDRAEDLRRIQQELAGALRDAES